MNDLSQTLRSAVADPPPTAIDLDALIAAELRTSHRRRLLAAGAAGTAALLAAGTVVALQPFASVPAPVGGPLVTSTMPCLAVRPTPSSTHDPSDTDLPPGAAPAPTEAEDMAVARLSGVLVASLAANLSGRTLADIVHPGCDRVQFEPHVYPAHYFAFFRVTDAAGTGIISIYINERPMVSMSVYDHHNTLPDGTEVGWCCGAGAAGEHDRIQLTVIRPDQTELMLIAENVNYPDRDVVSRPTVPATVTELTAILTDPGLSLYP